MLLTGERVGLRLKYEEVVLACGGTTPSWEYVVEDRVFLTWAVILSLVTLQFQFQSIRMH